MNRGILVTEYAKLKKEVTYEEVKKFMINIMVKKNLSVFWKRMYIRKQNG